jgi:hypothetical protein
MSFGVLPAGICYIKIGETDEKKSKTGLFNLRSFVNDEKG